MVTPTGPVVKPEAFWGSILLSARVHATTAEVWSAIRAAAAETGVGYPPGMFAAVNRMRSMATGLAVASERFAAADRSTAITSDLVGHWVYERTPTADIIPAYHVRFTLDYVGPEGAGSGWYNLGYTGSLPATVGDLLDDLDAYAETLGDSYGIGVTGVGQVMIGAY